MLIEDLGERDRFFNAQASIDAYNTLRTDAFHNIFDNKDVESGKITCPICMEEFEDNDPATVLKCDKRHIFHPDCIKPALAVKRECPLCREPVGNVEQVRDTQAR